MNKFTKAEKSWIMYDWANSVYATNMLAAIFPIYFALVASAAGKDSVVLWSVGTSIASFVVAILAPFLGALGDHKGFKKKLFTLFLLIGTGFTLFCAFTDNYIGLLVGYICSHIGFSGSNLFYDAFITDVTTNERMNKVSSWGYAMGYLGGSTIPFVFSILLVTFMDDATLAMKLVMCITSFWWLGFSIPILKNVKQLHYIEKPSSQLIKSSLLNLLETIKNIFKERKILFFLLGYFFYIDAVNTIISVSTTYGTTLGLDTTGMILALLVTQLVAIPCAIFFGKLSEKYNSLNMIIFAVIMYFFICILGFFMGYNIEINDYSADSIAFSQNLFWILAVLVGTVQGGIQAISRSYFGKLIPAEKSNEYFGFYDIFGKFAAVMGPALVAIIKTQTGSDAFGVLSLVALLVLGLVFILLQKRIETTA